MPSARWAEGERPRGLLGHELDIQVRDTHLNLPSTVTQSPGGTKERDPYKYLKQSVKEDLQPGEELQFNLASC